jgi:hypothetical protein
VTALGNDVHSASAADRKRAELHRSPLRTLHPSLRTHVGLVVPHPHWGVDHGRRSDLPVGAPTLAPALLG